MRDLLQTIREAVVLYFAPLSTTWFWLALILIMVLVTSNADAGYLWTD